jgi:hypothetical protein
MWFTNASSSFQAHTHCSELMKSVRGCYSFNTIIHVPVDGPSTGERLSLLFMLLVFIVSWFKFIPSVLFLLLRTESPYLEVFL